MAKVLGLGGLFFKSPDPEKLLAWYSQWLGIGDGKKKPAGEEVRWRNIRIKEL